MSLVLTPEEESLILRIRQENEKKEQRKKIIVQRLKTAYEFAAWMEENGRGPSFSAFVNEFGYQGMMNGESLNYTYELCCDLQRLAGRDLE